MLCYVSDVQHVAGSCFEQRKQDYFRLDKPALTAKLERCWETVHDHARQQAHVSPMPLLLLLLRCPHTAPDAPAHLS